MSKVTKKSEYVRPKNAIEQPVDDCGNLSKILLIITAVACALATVMFDTTKSVNILPTAIVSLCCVLGTAVVLAINNKLNTKTLIVLIFIAGFIIRLDYVLYTLITETSRIRQHDLFEFGGGKGHSGYIEHFYNNGFTLPDFNPLDKAQFYHPPLHHFLAALWMRLLTTFGMSYSRAVSSIQFLTLFYSSACMLVVERILSKLNLRGAGKVTAFAIIAFHPTFIILAGSINNDILSILFTLLAIYTALKWYNESTFKNIILIALSIGLGMSTKMSVAFVAFPVAFIFLSKYVKSKKDKLEYFGQYCAFGAICLPLGLWFSIKNYIKFDIPFTYVQKLSETSDQYIGNYTIFERLLDFSKHPMSNVFVNKIPSGQEYFEYNPFVMILKSSLFGEYNYLQTNTSIETPCWILFIFNVLLIILAVAAMVYCCIVKKTKFMDNTIKIALVGYNILLFVNFITFSIQYPHNCSMDYRYIVPTCVLGAIFIGTAMEQLECDLQKNKTALILTRFSVVGITSLFALFSIIVYLMLGVKNT